MGVHRAHVSSGARRAATLGGALASVLALAPLASAERPGSTAADGTDGTETIAPQPIDAQPVSDAPETPDALPLEPVPSFELTLPQPGVAPTSSRREGGLPWWPSHAYTTAVPGRWRDIPDSQLGVEIESGRWQLGPLSLSTHITTIPERHRLCQPECRGMGWSSSVRLGYELGDVGPLQDVGVQVELDANATQPNVSSSASTNRAGSWQLRAGVGGKF